ncbi:NADH dehydrogenase subunit G [Thiothrix eikelboomii]|uniref:NADH-quinone oxidoreductase n=1 Tax=Thiothrix eikelboomii TaxID=92487 RepID=A0A1T4VY72_9GAMM|nr:NADH-quinone oxidoreductase subunit NuoG [Thiothrix eikelboomii]SKA69970.1 NADH dehydrogenase subunit G [Thiothrix eikelboomii]
MSEDFVSFEVNGQTLQARPGSMLIAATDAAGITVPRFCYHKKLSVAANCRMCLVEVERAPKPLPACATPIVAGMKVWTHSAKARAAQQDVMEFLLINHPLDCPICDQGGECELQDLSLGFGNSSSEYVEIKRVVRDKDLGPLIETAMTRCIHCTRCVRFGEEIAGMRELGATGRSQYTEIGTYVAKTVSSELSGNVIDVCPVGALTAKPSRYTARPWEMRAYDSIAPHDCVGSNLHVHTARGKVVRVVPRENEAINECWISDRDRFSYEGLKSQERLLKPQIKRDGHWKEVSWQEALDNVSGILRKQLSFNVAALAGPSSSAEEFFLFQKLMRGLNITNIDHRLRQVDFSDQAVAPIAPSLGMSLVELEQQQAIFLIGAYPRHDQPLLNHRIRKASLAGAKILALNPRQFAFNYDLVQIVATPLAMVDELAVLVKASLEAADLAIPQVVAELLANVQVTETARAQLEQLKAERALILLGQIAIQHPAFSSLRTLASLLAQATGAKLGYLPEANSMAAHLAGVLPHRRIAGGAVTNEGLTVSGALTDKNISTLVLMNAELDDFASPQQALKAFRAAKHVIVFAPFADTLARDYATILLPTSTFVETAGSFINAEGVWQSFQGVVTPPGEARPLWKVLRVLGNALNLPDFDYLDTNEILAELKLNLQAVKLSTLGTLPTRLSLPKPVAHTMQRIGEVAMYRTDALVRRAKALQAMTGSPVVRMHPLDMDHLGISAKDLVRLGQGDSYVQLPAEMDEAIPVGCVGVQSGTEAARALGAAFGSIMVDKG